MSDFTASDLNTMGSWLSQNQDKKGTPEWDKVSKAFQTLDGQLNTRAQKNVEYGGLGGKVKAFAQGAGVGLTGDTLDTLNLVNPLFYATEGLHSLVTGQPFKMNRASSGYERLIAKPEDVPESARPSYYGGRAFGGSLGSGAAIGATLGAAAPALGTANIVGKIAQGIAQAPKAYAAGEAAAAGGAGLGTTVADYIAPDNAMGHLVGGLTGSVLGPGQLARMASKRSGGLINWAKEHIDPEIGVQKNIGDLYERWVREQAAVNGSPIPPPSLMKTGGQNLADPEVAKRMQQASFESRTLPSSGPATFMPDEVTQGVAAALSEQNPTFGYVLKQKGDEAIGSHLSAGIDPLKGDTGLLRQAAEADVNAQRAFLQGRTQSSQQAAQRASQQATQVGAAVTRETIPRGQIGEQLTGLANEALLASKNNLNSLDAQIGNRAILGPDTANQLLERYQRSVQATPTATLPDSFQSLTDIANNPLATLEDYRRAYSILRQDARIYRANPEAQRAAALATTLADNLRPFIEAQPGVANYNAAARAHADRFNRGLAQPVLTSARAGGPRNPASLNAEQILRGSGLTQQEKTNALLRMTDDPLRAQQLLQEEQRAQVARSGIFSAETGQANPQGVFRALQAEPEVYQQFPDLANQMTRARQATEASTQAAGRAENIQNFVQDYMRGLEPSTSKSASLTQQALGFTENPHMIVAGIMKSPNPVQGLEGLHKIAMQSPKSKEALNSIIHDYLRSAPSPIDTARLATTPVSAKSGQTLLDWMKARGYLNDAEHKAITSRLKDIVDFTMAQSMGVPGMDLQSKVPDLVDIAARLGGARIGGDAARVIGKANLIGPQVGSQFARKMVANFKPSQRAILEQKIANPQQWADFLEESLKRRGTSAGPSTPPGVKRIPYPLHPAQVGVLSRYAHESGLLGR